MVINSNDTQPEGTLAASTLMPFRRNGGTPHMNVSASLPGERGERERWRRKERSY